METGLSYVSRSRMTLFKLTELISQKAIRCGSRTVRLGLGRLIHAVVITPPPELLWANLILAHSQIVPARQNREFESASDP